MSRTGSVPKKPGNRWASRPAAVTFSREWMTTWADTAGMAQSVEEVNTKAGIDMMDYHRGRLEDPEFDALAMVFDQILDQRVLFAVRDKAIQGDPKAQVLYYGKVRVPAFVPGFPSWRAAEAEAEAKARRARAKPRDDEADDPPAITPAIAEAMLVAGVKAAEEAARVKDPAPRHRRRAIPPAPRPE